MAPYCVCKRPERDRVPIAGTHLALLSRSSGVQGGGKRMPVLQVRQGFWAPYGVLSAGEGGVLLCVLRVGQFSS